MSNDRKLLGVRVTPKFHKVIKQIALNNDVTVQEYVIGLILKDIEINQNELKNVDCDELKIITEQGTHNE